MSILPGQLLPAENKDPTIVHPPHYLHELPQEDEERLEKLFVALDTDGNGKIDIHDLSKALKDFGVHSLYAQVSMAHRITSMMKYNLTPMLCDMLIISKFISSFH